MPTVIHNKPVETPPGAIASKGGQNNFLQVLKLLSDQKEHEAEEVGHLLGVEHKAQAQIRGTRRLKGLVQAQLVKVNLRMGTMATFEITEHGLATLRSGEVLASPRHVTKPE